MAMTISDVHDLVVLLEKNPEWQTELRRIVLTHDLLTLPEIVRELAQAQQRTERRVEELAQAQQRTERRVEELAQAQQRTERLVGELAQAQQRTEQQVQSLTMQMFTLVEAVERLERQHELLNDQVADLRGWRLEWQYRLRAPAYFGRLMKGTHVLSSEELATLLDKAVDEGKLTEEERLQILATDIVARGRWRQEDRDVYFVVEVSITINVDDVTRASDRARALSQLHPSIPGVAGTLISFDAATAARDRGVWRVLDGSTLAPSDPR